MGYTYKIVEQKYKTMLGRFKAPDLEDLLNKHAMDGWEFDRILDADSTSALTNGREVLLVVLRREQG